MELYRSSGEEAERRAEELAGGVEQLQHLVEELTQEKGQLHAQLGEETSRYVEGTGDCHFARDHIECQVTTLTLM